LSENRTQEGIRKFKERVDKAIISTYEDGRERAFYIWSKDKEWDSSPLRVGSRDQVNLVIDRAWLTKRIKPDFVIWFHTHDYPSGLDLSTTDKKTFSEEHIDVACVGSVLDEYNPKPTVKCYEKKDGELRGEIVV